MKLALFQQIIKDAVREKIGTMPPQVEIILRKSLSYQSNALYDARAGTAHWIIKEYLKPEEFEAAPRREFDALQLMESLDIAPVPLCQQPPSGTHGPLVIYEFMEGQMWDRYSPQPHEFQELVDLWLTMHSVTHDDLWISRGNNELLVQKGVRMIAVLERYTEWVQSEFPVAQKTAELCLSLAQRQQSVFGELDRYDPPLRFCRADPRFANVIRRPNGRLGMVDWEDSGLRDPARDLADLITHPNQEDLVSHEQWQTMIDHYHHAIGPEDPDLRQRIHLYQAIFPIFWLTVLLNAGMRRTQQGKLAGWDANGLSAPVRLRRCLARGLAWPKYDFANEMTLTEDLFFFPNR